MANEFRTVIKVGMNSTGFQTGATEINRKIRVLDSSFKAVSQQAKSFGETTETLKQKQQALTGKIELQTQKVNKLKEKYEKSKLETGENSKATEKLAIAYNRSVESLNKMQGQLENTNKELEKQQDEIENNSEKLEEFSNKLEETGQKMQKAGDALVKLSAPVVAFGAVSGKMAMSFEDAMAKVSTISDETKVSTEDLGKGVVALSNAYGRGSEEIAEALYQTISASVSTEDSLGFLNIALKDSVAGFTDTTTAVDGLTSVINAYGLGIEEAGAISDQFFVTQKLGKTTFGEIAQSIGQVAPLASAAKVSTEELFASIATLTKQGIKTDESMTGIKSALSNIVNPSSEAEEAARKLGIRFSASALESKGFAKFLEDVKNKTHGNIEVMTTLFGNIRAANAVLALTSENGGKQFTEALDEMKNSIGSTDEAMEKMNTRGLLYRQTVEGIKNAVADLGNALLPLLQVVLFGIQALTKILGMLNPTIFRTIVIMGMMVGTLGIVLSIAGRIAQSISAITTLFGGFGMTMNITAGKVLIVVAALTALAAIIAVLVGKAPQLKSTFDSIGNIGNINNQNIRQPRIPRYAIHGSHAGGLDYVPFDGYIAELHKGERVQKADENPHNPNSNNSSGDTIIIQNMTVQAKDVKEADDFVGNLKRARRMAYGY